MTIDPRGEEKASVVVAMVAVVMEVRGREKKKKETPSPAYSTEPGIVRCH